MHNNRAPDPRSDPDPDRRTLHLALYPFLSFQDNEQFRIQEEKRKAREKKKAEEAARNAEAGGKVKTKPRPVDEEQEGCIVDRLLSDIRKGFPLRKHSRGTSSGGNKSASPTRPKRSRDEGGKDGFRKISGPAKARAKLEPTEEEQNEILPKRNLEGPSLPIR